MKFTEIPFHFRTTLTLRPISDDINFKANDEDDVHGVQLELTETYQIRLLISRRTQV